MFKLSLFCLPFFLFVGQPPPGSLNKNRLFVFSDSDVIEHTLDGFPSEWPFDYFQKDQNSGFQYAFDNDASYLYVIVSVKDIAEQIKMMQMSMKMYIDLKAKKKENMGIEFPVKKEAFQQNFGGGGNRNGGDRTADQDGERKAFDIQAMRQRMAINLISMKIFGFEGLDEPKEVGLTMFNSVHLVYNWDTANTFHLEYKIPLSMIAEPKSLDNKNITIGWKVLGIEMPSGAGAVAGGSGGLGGGRGGSGGGRGPGSGGRPASGSGASQDRQANFEKMREEQNIWAKYTFHTAAAPRGF